MSPAGTTTSSGARRGRYDKSRRKLSLTATPVAVAPAGLVIAIVMVDVPPTGILVGLKALTVVGTVAVKLAVIVVAFPPPVGAKMHKDSWSRQ